MAIPLHVAVERDDDGSMFATVAEMPGVFASGFDAYELEDALIEAIGMYLTTESVYVTFRPGVSIAAMILEHGVTSEGLELELVSA